MKRLQILLLLIFLLGPLLHRNAFSFELSFESKTRIPAKPLLQIPSDFCVTEDNLFVIVDVKDGNLKIYKNDGTFIKKLGSRGFGPNEFGDPLFCTYSNRKLIVFDVGQRKFQLYERKNQYDFIRTGELLYTSMGESFKLHGDKLYISGQKKGADNKTYGFFSFDLKISASTEYKNIDNTENEQGFCYLLPLFMKYGLSSEANLNKEIYRKPDLTAIGTQGRFDIRGKWAYYIWQGDLKIFKINLETNAISTFGKKTAYYRKPYASPRLIKAVFSRQNRAVIEERNKMSNIRDIIATEKHVLVLYSTPVKDRTGSKSEMVQVYTKDGVFVTERVIAGEMGAIMFFDRSKKCLYSIVNSSDYVAGSDEFYSIVKYRLSD